MQNTIRQPFQRPPGALPSSMLGCPNPLQVPKAQIRPWPTTQHQSMAHPRPHKPQSNLRLARDLPAEAPDSASHLRLIRGPSAETSREASARGETPPRSRHPSPNWDCNAPTRWTGAFIAKPPSGMVRVSGGVSSHAAQRTRPESRPPTPVTVPPFRRRADLICTARTWPALLPSLCCQTIVLSPL